MNRFGRISASAWSFLVVTIIAFALSGCEGSDGAAGAAGATGAVGPAGPPGPPGPVPDEVAAAIESSKIESCGTCHDGVGGGHQAIYSAYNDASAFEMTFTNFTSVNNGGVFDVTLEFTILKDGMPFTDFDNLDQKRFYVDRFDGTAGIGGYGEYYEAFQGLSGFTMVAPGDYVATRTGLTYDPTVSGQVYGYIAQGVLFTHDSPSSELPAGSHVHLYDDMASAAIGFGDGAATGADPYVSAANVEGCEKCHGAPYLKHGFRAAQVAGIPDFASCKVCHNDDGNGGHTEWQYMVDEPFNWATGVAETADYSYFRNVMNDTHMSHAMEFPYPMSMSNCNTCHEGKLTRVLDDAQFTAETCKSCHPVQGLDAWPEDAGTTLEGMYAQPLRAPAMQFLWTKAGVETFHDMTLNCQACHGTSGFSTFSDYHTGYDDHIYDATGTKFADTYSVSVDSVSVAGDLMTINFSSSDTAVVPELLVSFYGWDTKNFIVGSHERDANVTECAGGRPGCKMEYVPESSGGGANPLFTEDATSVPGAWVVTLDMAALQLTKTALLPAMIADGTITKAEVSITPELEIGGEDVVLAAVSETFDLTGNMLIADYFSGANAIVDIDKCNVCHDSLASTFHDGSGRGGDGIQVCKTCHTTTFPGSHIEQASRAIDSYVHAIHSFQPFDLDDVAAADDPVFDARNEQHIKHTFPNFTIRNCEACHNPGTYNVPDQSQSMPGVLSATWDIADRNIGTMPEYVTGPASRACGGCHRADLINPDLAGDLATFNAHTEAFGTLEENDSEDMVLFGIIDKIMSMF
jgi:OmcA/MtrC family decaheme c-type cytochrome